MAGYEPHRYGDCYAAVYDRWYPPERLATRECVDFLHRLSAGRTALDLGVGTGRIAIPLANLGVDVTGLDASQAMLDALAAKPGGGTVRAHLGDMRTIDLTERFAVVYMVLNTFLLLPSAADQQRCLRAVREHLEDEGVAVIETLVPDPGRFSHGAYLGVRSMHDTEVILEISRQDPLQQRVRTTFVELRESAIRLYPSEIRYVWPGELDLMADAAGLRLVSRLGGFDGRAFNGTSTFQVSCYVRKGRSHASDSANGTT